MPIFDESIFYPERVVKDLGFTDEDINEIAQFFQWHINQRNRGLEQKKFIAVLHARLNHLISRRRLELRTEFEQLDEFSR